MLIELLNRHFLTVFLMIGFSLRLWTRRGVPESSQRYYWMTVICTAVLIVTDSLDFWASTRPDLRTARLAFSVLGYIARAAAALSITLTVWPGPRRPFLLWIPFLLNAGIYISAFFTPIAFSISAENHFVRGPLGYTAFVVGFLYILISVIITWKRFRDRDHTRERFILYTCAVACVTAVILDTETDGTHVNTAIMISSIFLYMFLRSFDANLDPLTMLLNRSSFFEDCARLGSAVTAVGSADVNGLKQLNDAVGHEAGDEALRVIARSLQDISGKKILVYRTGGDEFAVLFLRQGENTVHDAMEKLKGMVRAKGYSVSTGYAMRGGSNSFASVRDLTRRADEDMYQNKAQFYLEHIHDRRRSPRR
ncbi:MAG: GGDEF domain-containing protein [Clostridia bacterium]|nr:GGDEF domain-containing protein [Clostridia bacterium]